MTTSKERDDDRRRNARWWKRCHYPLGNVRFLAFNVHFFSPHLGCRWRQIVLIMWSFFQHDRQISWSLSQKWTRPIMTSSRHGSGNMDLKIESRILKIVAVLFTVKRVCPIRHSPFKTRILLEVIPFEISWLKQIYATHSSSACVRRIGCRHFSYRSTL